MRNWEEYSQHILKSLKRIEEKLDRQESALVSHSLDDQERFGLLESRLAQIDRDLKWSGKIAAAIGSFIAIMVSWLLEYKKHG